MTDASPSASRSPGGGPGRKRLRGVLLALAAVGAVAGIWGLADYIREWPVHCFGVVKPGVLYRSAQPDPAEWRRLTETYGIRTVIDLRADEPNQPWSIAQREFCRDHGLRLVRVDMGFDDFSDDEMRRVLDVLRDPAAQPVLIHCEYGKSRTGVAVAAYRMAIDGWPMARAIEESREYRHKMEPVFIKSLERLAGRLRPLPARPGEAGSRAGRDAASR